MPSIVGVLATAAPGAGNNDIGSNEIAKRKLMQSDGSQRRQFDTFLPSVPVTVERQPSIPKIGDVLSPGVARANLAVSNERPDGTPGWREQHSHETVLQQHVVYWDPDGDGIIYPWDIYNGCRAWGWNMLLSLLVVVVIAPAMSYPTFPKGKLLPSPFLPIYIHNIHKDKHGSSSQTYDSEGRFRPQQFEDLFAKYDLNGKGGLDLYDLARMHKGQRLLMDPFGWSANFFEWVALYLLVWPEDGIIRKEDVRATFDGSIFQKKADEYAEKKKKQGGKAA
ncbi:Caleosin-domain-containing [Lecanosticta acicola]|uniref:Caleosin-domain-containing n=1 Tax=Lecanosticta acicola TaxID=111012 RepID=A0AAI9EEE0_9PEZI|nr:Caleosin-domain-containing [Lecanosticta acicola]